MIPRDKNGAILLCALAAGLGVGAPYESRTFPAARRDGSPLKTGNREQLRAKRKKQRQAKKRSRK